MKEEVRQEYTRRLSKLLEEYNVAMLTTLQPRDGSLHSRPMMSQVPGFDGSLWFFSRVSSAKVDEIRAGSQVNLAYSDPSEGRYLSISGVAYVEHNRKKMQELWREIYRAWFPRGLDEPDLALLQVEVHEVELWESSGQINGEVMKFD